MSSGFAVHRSPARSASEKRAHQVIEWTWNRVDPSVPRQQGDLSTRRLTAGLHLALWQCGRGGPYWRPLQLCIAVSLYSSPCMWGRVRAATRRYVVSGGMGKERMSLNEFPRAESLPHGEPPLLGSNRPGSPAVFEYSKIRTEAHSDR